MASEPSYCVSDLELSGGHIARLNGVAAVPGHSSWQIIREAGTPEANTGGSVGLGAHVEIQLAVKGGEATATTNASGQVKLSSTRSA